MTNPNNSYALYVHVPFCRRKCFFCSFVIYAGGLKDSAKYLTCLTIEAKKYFRKKICSIYIGGGTPTLLSEKDLNRLIKVLHENFLIPRQCEFTIETNPETMTIAKATMLKDLGVNRVSIGAQSFSNRYLKFLGRTHQAEDIRKCFVMLRKAKFYNINMDMMYGFPGQHLRDLQSDVDALCAFESEHVSLYALTIEPHSKFFVQKTILPSRDRLGSFYAYLSKALEKKNFYQYEISNFAKSGYISRHNHAYWNSKNYIGLGVGAHSHIQGQRSWNTSSLFRYLDLIQKKQSAVEGQECLTQRKRLVEAVIFGLRQNKGVDLNALERHFQVKLFQKTRRQIEDFVESGFLRFEKNRLQATPRGRLLLDELSIRLI